MLAYHLDILLALFVKLSPNAFYLVPELQDSLNIVLHSEGWNFVNILSVLLGLEPTQP